MSTSTNVVIYQITDMTGTARGHLCQNVLTRSKFDDLLVYQPLTAYNITPYGGRDLDERVGKTMLLFDFLIETGTIQDQRKASRASVASPAAPPSAEQDLSARITSLEAQVEWLTTAVYDLGSRRHS